jgi:cardiolipin synthase
VLLGLEEGLPLRRLAEGTERVIALRHAKRIQKADLKNIHPPTSDNRLELLIDGERTFEAMLQALDAAKEHIHVSFFILKDDHYGKRFAEKLAEKAAQGVKVRLMVDEGGALLATQRSEPRLAAWLRARGVEVLLNPVLKLGRNTDHRKLVAIDGRIAFTGGINLGQPYIDGWHDLMVRIEGSAVHQIDTEWMLSWLHLGGTLDPALSDAEFGARYFPPPEQPGSARVTVTQTVPGEHLQILARYLEAIDGATESIEVASPYVTSPEIQEALRRAARRGVAVRLTVPWVNNHKLCDLAARASFPAMIEDGIVVREYPGMSHLKAMVVDRRRAIVGTANLDDLSQRHDFELNLDVEDESFAEILLAEVLERDQASTRRVDPARMGPTERLLGSLWRLFSGAL